MKKFLLVLFASLLTLLACSVTMAQPSKEGVIVSAGSSNVPKLTATDSVEKVAKFDPTLNDEFKEVDAETKKLYEQLGKLQMIKQAKFEYWYKRYCKDNNINMEKSTIKPDVDGVKIKTRK